MKMTKRLLSALLALCMVMAMAPVTPVSGVAEGDTPISAGTTTVQLGEATEVTVTFVANGSAEEDDEYLVKYDTGVFSYSEEDCTDADVFELSKGSKKQNYAVVVDCYETGEYKNTTIGTVTFEIADDAAPGSYALTVDGETVGTIVLTPAFAPTEMTFRITSDKTELEPGDTFTVTYKIYSIPATGLSEYQFFNVFDETVFEIVSASVPFNFESYTNYGTVNLSKGMLCGSIGGNCFYGDTVLGTAVLKVKENAPAGQYTLDIDKTAKGEAGWTEHPTTFGYYGDKVISSYPIPAVATLTVNVKGEEPEPATYTVTWIVEGETVATATYKEGEAEPTYAGAEPTKAEDEKYTYAFTGWNKTSDAEGNITYTAQFEATAKPVVVDKMTFRITSDKETLTPGDTFTVTYKISNLPSTGLSEYQFYGLFNTDVFELVSAKLPTTIEGNVNYGTVNKKNAMLCGSVGGNCFYGDTVLGTATFKVKENAPAGQYTIDIDRTEYDPSNAEWLRHPTTFGYYDGGASTAVYPVPAVEPLTVTVEGVEPPTHTVTWIVEGEVVATATFKEGEEISAYAGETPEKPATAQYTYTFTGWDESTDAEGNTTYTAKFEAAVNEYTVTFKDGKNVLATLTYAYGATIDYTAPAKQPTAEYTYTFEKFEPALAVVTGDATYQVIYTETPIVQPGETSISAVSTAVQLGETTEVTVTFIANGYFEEDSEIFVKYDTSVFSYSEDSCTDADTFELSKGSKKQGYAVVVDCYETAEYSDFVIGTVTFEIAADAAAGSYALTVDGKTIGAIELLPEFDAKEMTFRITSDKTELEPGDTFTVTYKLYGIPATGLTEYQFYNSFDPAVFEFVSASIPGTLGGYTNYGTVNLTQSLLCGTVAPYTITENTVLGTATFKVKTGAPSGSYVIDIERTEYDPMDPAWQARPTAFGYYADGEAHAYPVPTVETLTVTVKGGIVPPEPATYTVTWIVEGEVVATDSFKEGEPIPEYTGETPVKPEDSDNTYTFTGWARLPDTDGNVTYTALFRGTPKKVYTVTWKVNGTIVETATFKEGEAEPSYTGATPTKPETATETFKFTGWKRSVRDTEISYVAQFETVKKMVFRILSDQVVVQPGDSFTVSYQICNIPETGLTEYQFYNVFDPDVFEFVSATIPGQIAGYTVYGAWNLAQYMLCGSVAPYAICEDSVLGTATFKVKETAAVGRYTIDIERTERDPEDPAWQAHPTVFAAFADGEAHAYPVPVVETLTMLVNKDMTPEEIMACYPELVGISVYAGPNGSGYEAYNHKFQWDLLINKSVLDMTKGAGTSANPYFFDVYYRIAGSSSEYACITCNLKTGAPIYDFQNGQVIYRLFMSDGNFSRLSKAEYEYVVVIRNEESVVGWEKLWSTWNDKTDDAYSQFIGEQPQTYTIIFKVNGVQYVQICAEGTIPSYNGDLLRPGFDFVGWFGANKAYAAGEMLPAVTTNRTYTALYRSYAEGDANGDGKVSVKDVTTILNYIADNSIAINRDNADVQLDTRINIADVTALLTKLALGNVTVREDEVTAALSGKKALFCGDSITAASTYDTEHKYWGWAGRISKAYGMKSYKNAGVDGASISTCRSSNRIVNQLKNNASGSYDFVILHGGTNDGWDSAPVGAMTASDCFELSAFDTSTYAGGLEELFYYAKKLYPNATIGYVINFRFNPGVGVGRMGDMEPYYTVGKQICEKWGIPYLSLFDNEDVYETLAPGRRAATFGDGGIHPNSMGYDVIYPYIAEFMAEIAE